MKQKILEFIWHCQRPAAGTKGAFFREDDRLKNLITIDIGGTSADVQ